MVRLEGHPCGRSRLPFTPEFQDPLPEAGGRGHHRRGGVIGVTAAWVPRAERSVRPRLREGPHRRRTVRSQLGLGARHGPGSGRGPRSRSSRWTAGSASRRSWATASASPAGVHWASPRARRSWRPTRAGCGDRGRAWRPIRGCSRRGKSPSSSMRHRARGSAACSRPATPRAEPATAVPTIARALRERGGQVREGLRRARRRRRGGTSRRHRHRGRQGRGIRGDVCGWGPGPRCCSRTWASRCRSCHCGSTLARTEPCPSVFDGAAVLEGFGIRRRLDGGYTIGSAKLEHYIGPDSFRHFSKFIRVVGRAGSISLGTGRRPDPARLPARRTWDGDSQSPFERCRILRPEPSKKAVRRVPGEPARPASGPRGGAFRAGLGRDGRCDARRGARDRPGSLAPGAVPCDGLQRPRLRNRTRGRKGDGEPDPGKSPRATTSAASDSRGSPMARGSSRAPPSETLCGSAHGTVRNGQATGDLAAVSRRYGVMALMLLALLLCFVDRTIISVAAIQNAAGARLVGQPEGLHPLGLLGWLPGDAGPRRPSSRTDSGDGGVYWGRRPRLVGDHGRHAARRLYVGGRDDRSAGPAGVRRGLRLPGRLQPGAELAPDGKREVAGPRRDVCRFGRSARSSRCS